jgi:stage IV sporulation protein FB
MLKLGPLRLHWSLLLGAGLFAALQPRPLLLLGYAAVLLSHVAGHAFAVAGTRLSVSGVMLHALGGELLGEGEVSPLRRSVLALSGVLGQLALLAGAALAVRHLPPDLADALIRRNGMVLLLNLIPVKPLDGAQAWRLLPRLAAASRATRLRGRIVVREVPPSRQVQKDVTDLLDRIRSSTKVR